MNRRPNASGAKRHTRTAGLGGMVRALAWEECRVGGAIAGTCVAVGLLSLISWRITYTANAWAQDRDWVVLLVTGIPLLTALLLILSTDYSGHMVGGFSKRILHFPVPVAAAVAVALVARTLFVLISASIIVAGCRVVFGDGPGYGLPLAITLFYLLAQTVDWMRAPLSGLSSLLAIAGALLFLLFLGKTEVIVNLARSLSNDAMALTAVLGLSVLPLFGVAIAAVHFARVGRRVGIPELWEWPWYVSMPRGVRNRPFATPVAAQLWFDVRRSWWILPGVTLLFCVLVWSVLWLSGETDVDFRSPVDTLLSFTPFVGIVFGAVMHGGVCGMGALRRNAKPLPQFLHPLTSAQFAAARISANAIVLVPMVAAVLAFHFALIGDGLCTEIIPHTLAIGATSYREVAWVLLGRGLLTFLIAWPLMNAGNRTMSNLLSAEAALAGLLAFLHYMGLATWESTRILLPVVAIAVAVGAHARAWRTGAIPLRALLIASCVSGVTACVLLHPILTATVASDSSFGWYARGVLACLGWASLLPLPYTAFALEVRRRRHGSPAPQDPAQHVSDASLLTGPARIVARCLAIAVALFLLWLAWPAAPAYESYLRAKGYPATPDELNAWYGEIPPEKNRALAYMKTGLESARLEEEFFDRNATNPPTAEELSDHLLILGAAELERGATIDSVTWQTTESYWREVTAKVAPELIRLGKDDSLGSRYSIDLRKTFDQDTSHLSQTRGLARQLSLDSLHWAVAKEPDQAIESILATIPLANSLSKEPLLISQLVRVAILGIAYNASEEMLNRSTPDAIDLVRLQRGLSRALPPVEERRIMDRAVIGEAVLGLHRLGTIALWGAFEDTLGAVIEHPSGSSILFSQFAYPAAGERIGMMYYYDKMLAQSRQASSADTLGTRALEDLVEQGMASFSPLAAIITPAIARVYDSEWRIRTQLAIARTAFAVERYRLATGHLPVSLHDLVPDYLSEVPVDRYALGNGHLRSPQPNALPLIADRQSAENGPLRSPQPNGLPLIADRQFAEKGPLRYRPLGDASFVVYSVGPDGVDDNGEAMESWYSTGDITFTVAPLSVRTGDQVAD